MYLIKSILFVCVCGYVRVCVCIHVRLCDNYDTRRVENQRGLIHMEIYLKSKYIPMHADSKGKRAKVAKT